MIYLVQDNPEYAPPAPTVGIEGDIVDLASLNTLYPPVLEYLGWLAVIKNSTYTKLYQCRYNGAVYSWVEILGGITALSYEGTWDAATNTPVLADGTGTAGQFYVVSVAGSQDLGSGLIAFGVTDWVMHDGLIWQKVDNTAQVTSVFTRMGAVTAQSGDYTHAQIGSVGTDDHHAKLHAGDHLASQPDDLIAAGIESDLSLNNLGEKDHDSLSNVSTDQHHPQAHTLASHSSKDHSELTNVTTSQHHIRYDDTEAKTAMGAKADSNPYYHDKFADVDQIQVVYFGKHGNDTWSGLVPNEAVLTMVQAIVIATAMVPAGGNQVCVECLDAGTYIESPTFPEYVHLEAPHIVLLGDLTFVSGCSINIGSVLPTTAVAFSCSGNGEAYLKFKVMGVLFGASRFGVLYTAGTGNLYVEFDSMDGGALGFGNLGSGLVSVRGCRYESDYVNAIGIGIITTGEIEAIISDIYVPNGTGLYTRTSGRINVMVNHINAGIPWSVGAGSYLDATINEVTGGTPIQNGDANILESNRYSKLLQLIDTVGGLVVTNVSQPIDWDLEDIKDSFYIHSTTVNPSEVTIAEAGLYKLSVMITIEVIDATGGIRGNPQLHIDIDTGGGWVQQPDNMGGYSRENTAGQLSCSITGIGYFFFNAGDKIRVTTVDTVPLEPNEQTAAYSQRLLMEYERRFK